MPHVRGARARDQGRATGCAVLRTLCAVDNTAVDETAEGPRLRSRDACGIRVACSAFAGERAIGQLRGGDHERPPSAHCWTVLAQRDCERGYGYGVWVGERGGEYPGGCGRITD